MMIKQYNDFASSIIHLLEEMGIDYAIGGSFASSMYGESRSSIDIDISVIIPQTTFEPFVKKVTELGYYVTWDSILDAMIWKTPFNVIDATSGFKADMFLVEPSPLEQSIFERRRRLIYDDANGYSAYLYSPEDVIVYKLKYYLEGRMEKHPRDIAAMLLILRDSIDYEYLEHWVSEIGAKDVWKRILEDYHRRLSKK